MALNIKNPEVERLATEVARLTGVSKTEAIRRALEARKRSLASHGKVDRPSALLRFLESEIWPAVPKRECGRRLTRAEEDAILGYDASGK